MKILLKDMPTIQVKENIEIITKTQLQLQKFYLIPFFSPFMMDMGEVVVLPI